MNQLKSDRREHKCNMQFEEILAKCGNNGRYQYMLLAVLWISTFLSIFQVYSQDIISFRPKHWCYHEQLENRSFEEIENIYAKFDKPSCTRLDTIDGNNVTLSTEPCERWIYKYDFGFRSMTAELNWVCDSVYKSRVGQSLFFVGIMIGNLCFGILGDRIGRLKASILAKFTCCLGDLLTILTDDILIFSACRFVAGFGAAANVYILVILLVEYFSPALLSFGFNAVFGLAYSSATFCSPWLAVWVGHWRTYLLFTSLPLLPLAFSYFVVQESAQWLITRNDINGAIQKLRRVAKINGRTVHDEDFNAFYEYCEQNYRKFLGQEQPKLKDVLKWPRLRRRALRLTLMFIIMLISTNIITRHVEGMGISPFIMFSINALAVLPSGIMQGHIQHRFGRKTTSVTSMLGTFLFSLTLGLFLSLDHADYKYLIVFLAALTRLGINMSHQSVTQLSIELIPTSVRSRGFTVIQMAGFGAAFFSPYIQHIGTYLRALPFLVVAVLISLGIYICLSLPETSNKRLAISLEEGNEFGKDENMFDFIREIRNSRNTQKEFPVSQIDEDEKLMTRADNMNYLIQRGKMRQQAINVPEGLPELLSDITREVLRCQPTKECLCQFIIDYLHSVIVTREKAMVAKSILDRALRQVDSVISDLCVCDLSKEKSDMMAKVMEDCFRNFLEKRRCEMRRGKEMIKFADLDMLEELIRKCNFSEEELDRSRPAIESGYKRFVDAYMAAAKDTQGTEILYQYFRDRELKRLEEIMRNKAATTIQAAFRGYLVREMMAQDVCVCTCQMDSKDDDEYKRMDHAARVIQRFFRSVLARKSIKPLGDPCMEKDTPSLKDESRTVSAVASAAAQSTAAAASEHASDVADSGTKAEEAEAAPVEPSPSAAVVTEEAPPPAEPVAELQAAKSEARIEAPAEEEPAPEPAAEPVPAEEVAAPPAEEAAPPAEEPPPAEAPAEE